MAPNDIYHPTPRPKGAVTIHRDELKETRLSSNNHTSEDKLRESTINKLTIVGVGGNVVLTLLKFIAGILGNSMAMVSDAIHSLSDVLATAIAFAGSKVASKEADEHHQFGHERFECLASLALGIILAVTGLSIGVAGAQALISGSWQHAAAPTYLALGAAVVSIVVKEAMFHYTRHHARIIKSSAFEADAWHHRSDALSSIGALVGIGASILGFPMGDAIASIVICGFILKVAWEVISDAVNNMMDTPCGPEMERAIGECITAFPQVIRLDMLRTRSFGSKIFVDAEIALDGSMSLHDAHEISHDVHDAVERKFPDVKHIMIHVNSAD